MPRDVFILVAADEDDFAEIPQRAALGEAEHEGVFEGFAVVHGELL